MSSANRKGRQNTRVEHVTLDRGVASFAEGNSKMSMPLYGAQFETNGRSVAMASMHIPFSHRNITVALNNNTFSYILGAQTFVVTMPDGNYEIADVNGYMRSIFDQNNHYLTDDQGTRHYYIAMAANRLYYRTTFNHTVVPAVLPVGWTDPNPGAGSIITLCGGQTPQLVIPANFSIYIGQTPGTYPAPPLTADASYNGDLVPRVNLTATIHITLPQLVNNSLSNDSSIFSYNPAEVLYGDHITIRPQRLEWYELSNSSPSEIVIQFLDQERKPVLMEDQDITVTLAFSPSTETYIESLFSGDAMGAMLANNATQKQTGGRLWH